MSTQRSNPVTQLLLVDDDPKITRFVANALPPLEYHVHSTDSCTEALNLLEQQPISVVIADTNVADIDSTGLYRSIRENNNAAYVYIILATEPSREDEIASAIHAGADDYLVKPFKLIELLAKLHIARRSVELHRELAKTRQTLEEYRLYDALTGTCNRRYFMRQLRREVFRAERYKHPLAVILCNIDNMTSVNAQYSNRLGDSLLQQFALILSDSVRENIDFTGRISGDEFALLLPETKTANAMLVASRIRETVAETTFDVMGQALSITARLGVAGMDRVDTEAHTPDAIIAYAKYFIDQCKNCGGNATAGLNISSD